MCVEDPSVGNKNLSVWAYTNADEAELFVNGVSAGRQQVNKSHSPMGRSASRHVQWSVPYTAGSILAKGYVGGKVSVQDSRETTSAPTKLALSVEWPASG